MDNSAQLAGRIAAMALFACPAVYFLVRGLAGGPRSRRLANLALFCGLTAFVMPEMTLGSAAYQSELFLVGGAVRVLVGLAGIVLAGFAFVGRRDGGVGVTRPLIGAGFSSLHLMCGGGLLVYSSFTGLSTPWVYESPDGAIHLTLPSGQWKEVPVTGGASVVAFIRPVPRMQASVLSAKRERTEADFARSADAFQKRMDPQQRAQTKSRDGTNAAGNLYRFSTLIDSAPDGKPVFVAYSVTWCPRKQMVVEVIFEGVPTMLSQSGKAAEMEAFEKSAETICLSVE